MFVASASLVELSLRTGGGVGDVMLAPPTTGKAGKEKMFPEPVCDADKIRCFEQKKPKHFCSRRRFLSVGGS